MCKEILENHCFEENILNRIVADRYNMVILSTNLGQTTSKVSNNFSLCKRLQNMSMTTILS